MFQNHVLNMFSFLNTVFFGEFYYLTEYYGVFPWCFTMVIPFFTCSPDSPAFKTRVFSIISRQPGSWGLSQNGLGFKQVFFGKAVKEKIIRNCKNKQFKLLSFLVFFGGATSVFQHPY